MQNQTSPDRADETNRILLVDDDATNLDVLRTTLEGHNYRLFFARSGEDALKVARRTHPGLILLDVVMAGIDGYETCRLLKQDPETRDAAVIFLSALDDAKDKVRGFEAGAVDFVTKPFQGDEVLARVHTHLSIQRLLRRQHEAGPPTTPHVTRDDETGRSPGGDQQSGSAPSDPNAATDVGEPRRTVFLTGEVVAYRFRIVRYLAKGGMGELYEAEDLELHERVALKTILSRIAADERSILLFKREVHLARQVTHANVCRIFDVFRHRPAGDRGAATEVVFLAMELLHGETLADRLARDGRWSTAEVLPIVRQLAAGLAAAHRVGVVHRDFKSQNVMLVEAASADDGLRAVITDFGLAQRSTHDARTSMALLSDTPEISGTPAYMAPEQVEGGAVTPATDIYALGVVLFELVTGTWPFMAETPLRTAVKRLQEPPPSPRIHVPDLDPVWEETILRCLARAPADRFVTIGDVVVALEGRPRDDRVANDRAHRWPRTSWVLALVLSAATLAGGWFAYTRFVRAGAADGITSLAVLPLVNTSRDPQQDYLSDGISESLINRLSQLPGLKVVANSSSSRYKGKDADPQDVARALGVDGVLAGKVLQRGNSVSISVELIDGRDRTLMWGEQYVRPATDLLQVQGDISREIAGKLQLRLTQGQQQRLATPDVRSPEAYELLLKGRFHRAKGSADDRQKAGDYFARAIAVDPDYALAHADLSDIYRSLVSSSLVDPAEYLPKARAAARRALELDENLAEAHYALANLMTYAWEWNDAEREYQRAIALNPNLALAHRWYASYLGLVSRHDEAIAEIMRARELDPLSPGVNATVGLVLTWARRYEHSIVALEKTIELDPNYPYSYVFLGSAYAAQRRYADAVAAYQKAITLGLDTATTQVALGAAYAQAGDDTRARAVLARLQSRTDYVSSGELAILLAALGEREEAFTSLEKAHDTHDLQLQYLGVNAGFDPLRADPRFQDLLRRVGLAR
jgi:serine/threonine protein kinase/tetratricopeptide (TPR) repeat protein/ActR/RegA family two-component response regulator